jgi:uncharacterized protein (TIGR02147 family)
MMKPNVFDFNDYKKLLIAHAKSTEAKRGYLRELAEAAGCQRSYFSSILHTKNHLTPDQACSLTHFWNLNNSESEYFLTLVDLARAGTSLLKQRLNRKLAELRKEHEDLTIRMASKTVVTAETGELVYYSSWIYSALHILASISLYQRPSAMAERLNIPEFQIRSCLAVLKQMKLVEEVKADHWRHSSSTRHVHRNSPLVVLHHNNWRQRAILDAQMRPEDGVHFTGVHSVSESDFARLKEFILKQLEQYNQVAGASECEKLVCLNIDLFEV